MAIVVEFTLPSDEFPFGQAMSGDPAVKVWLERLVPLAEQRFPFVWARGDEFDDFERVLRAHGIVKSAEAVTRIGDNVLYYVEWREGGESFLNGLETSGGTVLEAHGDSSWSFTVRFKNHDDLTSFHQFYQREDYPVYIDQVSQLQHEPGQNYTWDLTPTQREALQLALENGYFAVPRETKLEEIANELGISRQATSELVRRGTGNVLKKALVGFTAADFEAAGKT